MSRFVNTEKKNTINSLVDGFKEKLDNPYYTTMTTKATITTYYNINTSLSTVDKGTNMIEATLGKSSPLKYNKINNFYLYTSDKIATNFDNGEWGLEADSIEGEAMLLPNTIVPIPGDFFSINYLGKDILFKVLSFTTDTLDNGSNFYKIIFKLDQINNTDTIEKQVVDHYEMLINNTGTRFNTIIRKTDYDFIVDLEETLLHIKQYYIGLFYSDRVQTFIFKYNGEYFYDPYMIEFLSRNSILKNNEEYLYIGHQTSLPRTFSLDYDRTFFRFVECPERKDMKHSTLSQGKHIDEYLSIFETRYEDYFEVQYLYNESLINPNEYVIKNIDPILIDHINENRLYDENTYLNIIIKYFNNQEININDINLLKFINYEFSIEMFYNIPIIVFILEKLIENLLKK